FLFDYLLVVVNPHQPIPSAAIAIKLLASNTPNLAAVMSSASLNANDVINNDIVKPIPASTLNTNKWRYFTPGGKLAMLSLMSPQLPNMIPKGLPIISANVTASIVVCPKDPIPSFVIDTPAFARAKSGIIRNATQGCSWLISATAGDISSRR